MRFFEKLFGTRQQREAKRLIDETRRHVDSTYGPLHALGMAVVETAYTTYRRLGPVFGFSGSGRPSEHQMLLFYELLYFFAHLTIRTAAAKRLSETNIQKLQGYLGPLLASTAVDTFCRNWPEELKSKMRNEFFQKLNDAELEYAACHGLVSQSDPLNDGTLVGKFQTNAVALFERTGDSLAELAVGTEILGAFANMNLDSLVCAVATVIEGVDDRLLESFWHDKDGEKGA